MLPSGSSIELCIHTPNEGNSSITDDARAAFVKMVASEQAARVFAAAELLPIHNEEWNDGEPIENEDFIRRLIPSSIQVWPNGDAEIAFGDDGLFWGHEIGIRYRGGRFTEAVVQG